MKNISQVAKKVELICENVTVFGDVHEESIIDAHKLYIKACAHKDSTQFANYAQIHEHKGTLRCNKAEINILNGGEVHASSVSVDQCMGGSIFAQDIVINELSSDLSIFASHSITINTIKGSHNTLNINYKKVPILISKLELIEEDIQELSFLLQEAKTNNAPSQKDIANEIHRLKEEYTNISNSAKDASITIHNHIKTHNTISFEIDDKQLEYQTQDKQYPPFHLKITDKSITLHPSDISITL